MKDPAFLFYSDNFQSGTQFFTDEQVGKYIRLLCAQHLHGHLHEKHMLFICKTKDIDIWEKFTIDDEGKYYNERLELEITKRKKFSESRANNRIGKVKKALKPIKELNNTSLSHDNHVGNGNESGIILPNNKGISNKKKKEIIKIDLETAKKFYEEQTLEHKDGVRIREYKSLLNYLFKTNPLGSPAKEVLSLEYQMTYEQFTILINKVGERNIHQIYEKIEDMINTPEYLAKKSSLYMTLNSWFNRDNKK